MNAPKIIHFGECDLRFPISWRLLILGMRGLLAITILLAVSVSARADAPDPCASLELNKKTVQQLLPLLDDAKFATRNCASEELEKRLPNLKPAELELMLKTYVGAPPQEQAKRLEKLLTKYLETDLGNRSTNRMKEAFKLVQVRISSGNGSAVGFKFGTSVIGGLSGSTSDISLFVTLSTKWNSYRDDLGVPCVGCALNDLADFRNFINGLTDAQFKSLNLTKGKNAATKQDVFDLMKRAEDLLNLEKQEIQKQMGFLPNSNLPKQVIVAGAGAVDLGKTVVMNIQAVTAAGTLDYAWTDDDLAYGPVPTGFVVYGPRFDLQVDQALQVSGAISFSIQYGDSNGDAYGITDPSKLAIIRIANGADQLLDAQNDLSAHTITGVYAVSSSSQEPDQFGEFVLVGAGQVVGKVKFAQIGQQVVMVYTDHTPLPVGP